MERFRPNIVLDEGAASTAWAEDDWGAFSSGVGTFRLVKPCSRCTVPQVDPQSAAVGAEPTQTLRQLRKGKALGFAQGRPSWSNKLFFGWNCVLDGPGTVLRCGDPVSVELRRTAPA